MELQAIKTANYLDIVFDNRNKAYGSYQLRKDYNKRTLTAFSLVLFSILTTCAYYTFFNHHAIQIEPPARLPGIVELSHIEPPVITLPKEEITPPAAEPKVNTVKDTPPVIVADSKVLPDDLPVENKKLDNAVPGTSNSEGTATTASAASTTGDGTNTHTISEPPANTKPFTMAQEMPEFNGNIGGYLQRQLKYPNAARDNGIEGQVIVQFVVNEDGHISDAKVLRGIGGGCNEEALRVVSGMPRWKPGKQNGKAVKVYYTLPIRFQLD